MMKLSKLHHSDALGHYFCSDHLNLAYLRIPKCACTTIETWMASQHPNFSTSPGLGIHSQAANKTYFDGIFYKLPDYTNYFRFTLVRDPESRFLSFFYDKLRGASKKPEALQRWKAFGLHCGMPLIDCLTVLSRLKYTDEFNPHFAPQHHFLFARGNLRVDFIGRLERFPVSVQVLHAVSGSTVAFSPRNVVSSGKTKRHLTPKERKLFLKIYQKDYELLGYRPGPV